MTENQNSEIYSPSFDVVLEVGNKTFFLQKEILRERCVYFEAMFSGKFAEDSQEKVVIEIISSKAMTFILDYLYRKIIEVDDLNNVTEYMEAATFFQLPDLVNTIIEILIKKIDIITWCKIMQIAKLFNLNSLESKAKCFGLYNFDQVRKNINCIDNLSTLHWYLSHQYLNLTDEYHVFQAGCDWLLNKTIESNHILVVLSCLNYSNLDIVSLENISKSSLLDTDEEMRFIIDIIVLLRKKEFLPETIASNKFKTNFINEVNQNTYDILCSLLLSVKERHSIQQPCVIRKRNDTFLKKFNPKVNELTNWIEISKKSWWGHNIVVWKGFNIVVLCGETSMGKNIWNTNILMYSILEEKWKILNALPISPRRHAEAIIHEDNLYLIGGVNSFRITLSSVMKYDLIRDTWESLPDLPECCQTPVATFHNNELYVSAEMLYVFRNNEWVRLFKISMRHNTIVSFKNNLYFTKNWRNTLSCWKTGSEIEYMRSNEQLSKESKYNITSMCLIGKFVYLLTEPEHFEKQTYCIERCNLDEETSNTEMLMEKPADADYSYNTSDCLVIPSLDIEDNSINDFGKTCLQTIVLHQNDLADNPAYNDTESVSVYPE